MSGNSNPAYISDLTDVEIESEKITEKSKEIRDRWGKDIEFLFSCIALSVGLGNIWRFPFVALENGGGAFLIPYLIVLVVIGRPIYFMEMALGQFSSGNSVKVFNCVPLMRGVGMGQVLSTCFVSTYYSSIMAITLKYLFDSFSFELPWSYCRPEWKTSCLASGATGSGNVSWIAGTQSSSELYFLKNVIKARENISNGIGLPDLQLFGFLVLAWTVVFLILLKGIKSTGKAAYVLAVAPYVILLILLVRALTLPGSMNGIKYLFNPQWDRILEPKVWYAAVTQVFFSLNIFFGSIVNYSSYNKFTQNIYRDANIITTLDTFTSLLAGCCTFGIIGHLAHELGVEDVTLVVKGGPGMAFISYPDALAKLTFVPQFFSAFFFLMLFLLGIGSLIAMVSVVITLVKDRYPKVKDWQGGLCFTIFGIISASVYLTPGGQSVLGLIDFYGATFVTFILAVAELLAFCYIYGVERICKDIEFMLQRKMGFYWRVCWRYLTPGLMTAIVVYTLWNFELPKDGDYDFPKIAHVIGWSVAAISLSQVLIFAAYRLSHNKTSGSFWEKIKIACRPTSSWGPRDSLMYQKYQESLNK